MLTKMRKKSRTEEDEPWEWHVEASPLQQLEIKEELGRGGSGVVFLAKLKGLSYALKRARPSVENVNRVKKEIDIMRAMSHPLIMRPLRDGIYEGVPAYLMELGESMESFCTHNQRHIRQTEKLNQLVHGHCYFGIVQGLHYMRSIDLVHGDIKPSNMLITKCQIKVIQREYKSGRLQFPMQECTCDMTVKLSDFGSAGKAGKGEFETCARYYAAPEVRSGTVMRPEHDFHSFKKSFEQLGELLGYSTEINNLPDLDSAVRVTRYGPPSTSTGRPKTTIPLRCGSDVHFDDHLQALLQQVQRQFCDRTHIYPYHKSSDDKIIYLVPSEYNEPCC